MSPWKGYFTQDGIRITRNDLCLIILRFIGNSQRKVTLTLLWTEYCLEASAAGKKPYMSTQFNDNYHKWDRITKATIRIQHKPGDEMEVDWAGATIDIYDEVTGEVSSAYLFVAVLCGCF